MAGFETIVTLRNEAATEALGARIAAVLAPGDVIALSGGLGAGKTALARSILRARGVEGHVPSPTFTLVQTYDTPGLTVHHFDLYRIEDYSELRELGLDEAREDGAVLIEWPERGMPEAWMRDALHIVLSPAGETVRELRVAGPVRWQNLFDPVSS
ncbi:MAG TPA: tRNA (adenosine(37)-N6)-threonylcarbamoyltransferase complex ATPase subunit type 1 TsaE [Micropepsaceae bacterium]|nr:tRNA (adenosine(37)-N6)-threonylcarbamoyltransferase complex ATPase subunit type 1 TsaE [Micropepsaceae bacterium]